MRPGSGRGSEMGLIDKWLQKYQDDWCQDCKCEMEKLRKQLYALPCMVVGHYTEHRDPFNTAAPSAESVSPCWIPSCRCGERKNMRAIFFLRRANWTNFCGGKGGLAPQDKIEKERSV